MWLNECKIHETNFMATKEKCDQPGIIAVAGIPICFKHNNIVAKQKIKKRKNGDFYLGKAAP